MARLFNGSTDQIDCGSPSVLNITGSVSLSAWIYLASSFGSGYQAIFGRWDDSDTPFRSYLLTLSGSGTLNGCVLFLDQGGSTHYVISSQAISFFPGGWHHVAGTFNVSSGNAYLYIDGTLSNSASTGLTGLSNAPLDNIIGNGNSSDAYFDGTIADVAIWSGVLTAQDIAALAAGMPPWLFRDQPLVGYWPLDGLQSPEPDLSGNQNNGTLTGTSRGTSGPPTTLWFGGSSPLAATSPPPPPTPLTNSPILTTRATPATPGTLAFLQETFLSPLPSRFNPPNPTPSTYSVPTQVGPAVPGSLAFLQRTYTSPPPSPPGLPNPTPSTSGRTLRSTPVIPGTLAFLQQTFTVYPSPPPLPNPTPSTSGRPTQVGPVVPGSLGFLQKFFTPFNSPAPLAPPPPPPPSSSQQPILTTRTSPVIPGTLSFLQQFFTPTPTLIAPAPASGVLSAPVSIAFPNIPGAFWQSVFRTSDLNRGNPTPTPPSPPVPPGPIAPVNYPLLTRNPFPTGTDQRIVRFANNLSAMWNSLVRQGILRQTDVEEYTLVLNDLLFYYPQQLPNWSGTPPADIGTALDRIAAWIASQGGTLP